MRLDSGRFGRQRKSMFMKREEALKFAKEPLRTARDSAAGAVKEAHTGFEPVLPP
jgi:hypothetical protein